MIDAPRLSRHDIEEQLEKLYRTKRERHLVAFFGTGTAEELRFSHMPPFQVLPVRSELELRERMPPLGDHEARIAFLVPWAADIPLDLAGRFARGGRVLQVGPVARLLTLLGATEPDDDVRKSPLATYLLAAPPATAMQVPGGRLTLSGMYNAWLRASWGVDVSGGLGLDTLLAWAATDERGAQFTAAMNATVANGVREALLGYLEAQLGVAGPVVWTAWERGQGRTVLAYALLLETLATSEHAGVKMWVHLAPRAALGVKDEATMSAVAKGLGASADGALRQVRQRVGVTFARGIVQAADGLADTSDVREALAGNRRLPIAWRSRLDALGRALAETAEAPSSERVGRAAALFHALDSHEFFLDGDHGPVIARAEMAVRLAAWLAARPDRELKGPPTPHADAELLGRWYAAEGGYVDWARRSARGTGTDVFGTGVNAVVAAADAAREELDARFARALSSWIEAGRPAVQILPIDHAVKRVAVRFLEEDASRRLLVLLIDGMAWAQAVELLGSLAGRTVPWGPLAWHASAKGRIGDSLYPAVIANLPTVTDVSRAAFFAGKTLAPGAAWSTAKDTERWAEHRDVKKLFEGTAAPRLLLRAEGHTTAGSASPEALSLVADGARRVVAIVINAIDASLKGDPQERHAWTVESIRSLPELLDGARESGRAVLLASDHGHVPADRLASKGAVEKGGARWRPWLSPGEALSPHERGFRGDGVWTPKGAHGVVLLTDDASRYGGGAHAGEHGGATLAEVVAPCLLVGCEDLGAPDHQDRDLDVGSAHVPPWWYFEVPAATLESETAAPRPAVRPKKVASDAQLHLLPALAPPPPPVPATKPSSPPPRASAFAGSRVLESLQPSATERRHVVEAVDFLLERQGIASEAAFAAAMKIPAWRTGGLVSRLGEVLNIDGYQVIRHDAGARTIHLDREKLAQQFEVKL